MIITINAFVGGEEPTISVSGQTITYNGVDYDLSSIPENSQAEGESPAVGLIKNIDGVIHITLDYPYSTETAEPYQSTDLADYIFDVVDGEVPSPIVLKPEPEPEPIPEPEPEEEV